MGGSFLVDLKVAIFSWVSNGEKRVLRLYNYEYFPLIGIALLIAAPLSWFAVNTWLASFAYRISMEPGTFLIACGHHAFSDRFGGEYDDLFGHFGYSGADIVKGVGERFI